MSLTHHELTVLFISLGVLLAWSRALGEIARRFRQPAILGEIIAGIILGPTIFGSIAPSVSAFLFPVEGGVPVALEGFTTVAIVLFLLLAGMEVDLSAVWHQGKTSIFVSIAGIIIPFSFGFASAWFVPQALGVERDSSHLIFSLFFATALSISALPVIAKILMDLNLYRSDIGTIIISAAIVNDLAGWIIFAIILSMMGHGGHLGISAGHTIALTLAFAALMLTAGRWFLNRIVPFIQARASWPTGSLGFAVAGAFFCAAFTEWIGIHAIFGAFLFGVALGDSPHLSERTRAIMAQFISFIFAPIFFATIGLRVNFAAQFDFSLVVIVLLIASMGKILGCGLGARLAGLKPRESLAIGFGMNARGAMEIILGLLALQMGVIREKMFVALVITALVTSMLSGSMIQKILKIAPESRRSKKEIRDY